MGRRGNNNSGGGGPLLTGHLQDIDLELELLKRKREMIEQQQQLLVMEQQFQTSRHSYDQMRYDEPVQQGSNRDFTHLYETGTKHRTQFGRKRQAENQWQYDSAPKRTSQKKKNPPQFNQHGSGYSGSGNFRAQKPYQGQGFNQGSKFSPRAPAPLMDVKIPKQSIGQRIANQKAPPKPAKKDFAPSKVSKPKAPPAPNKLASLPVTERKTLVAAASASTEADVSRMLLPDREPTPQVTGRLELGLGAIMKNIRALIAGQPQHASVLRSIQLQRVMKQAVRERIRTVMLGKVVGSLPDILAIYREEFPEETDADVLNIALEAGGISAPDQTVKTKFIKSGDPNEFFKVNMSSLLETKLNEMFSKLEELYGDNAPANDEPAEEQTDLDKNKEVDLENKENGPEHMKESSDLENNIENALENNKDDPENNKDDTENKEGGKEIEKNEDADLEKNTKIELQKNIELDLVKNKEEHNKNKEFTQEYKDFLNSTIKVYEVKRVIPKLIKRYVPYIVKLLSLDVSYQTTKAAIIMKANEKAVNIHGAKGPEQGQGDATIAPPTPKTPNEQRQMYNLPYYVKIMGRPTLPKRKVMQVFLSKFNPQSIKKHRTIHNLLFVGFAEKTDFDVMVGADGTIIGRSTLSIRICTNQTPRESNGENNESNDASFVKTEDQNDNDIITPELDGQITDLLSAIRKSEEEEIANKENGEINEIKEGEEKPLTENNSEEVNMEQGDNKNDEENAGNEENVDENITEGKQGEEISEDIDTQNSEAAKETETQDEKVDNETENPEVTDLNKEENLQESNGGADQNSNEKTPTTTEEQSDDRVGELKSNGNGRSTPSRMSARLANVTPSTIRTRRASRLASQN